MCTLRRPPHGPPAPIAARFLRLPNRRQPTMFSLHRRPPWRAEPGLPMTFVLRHSCGLHRHFVRLCNTKRPSVRPLLPAEPLRSGPHRVRFAVLQSFRLGGGSARQGHYGHAHRLVAGRSLLDGGSRNTCSRRALPDLGSTLALAWRWRRYGCGADLRMLYYCSI